MWISTYSKQHFLKIPQFNCLFTFVKDKLTMFLWSSSQFSVLFHWPILLLILFCLDYSRFIMSLKSSSLPTSFFLTIWILLPFHINIVINSSMFARSLFWGKCGLHWIYVSNLGEFSSWLILSLRLNKYIAYYQRLGFILSVICFRDMTYVINLSQSAFKWFLYHVMYSISILIYFHFPLLGGIYLPCI